MELKINTAMTTFIGSNPRAIKMGAAIAAGVPKPEAPSTIKAKA